MSELEANPGEEIFWGSGAITFRARIQDRAVHQLARSSLARFLRSPSASSHLLASWGVSQCEDGSSWAVRRDLSATNNEFAKCSSIEGAVSRLEDDALDVIFNSPLRAVCAHAALLRQDDRSLLVFGPHQSGKSTLACALWQAGWQLATDDLVLIDLTSGQVAPAPRRVGLRPTSRAMLGEQLWDRLAALSSSRLTADRLMFCPLGFQSPREEDPIDSDRGHTELSKPTAAIFLNRLGAELGGASVRRIEPVNAALAWLAYSNQRTPQVIGRALAGFARTVDAVPCFDLARSSLTHMITRIDEILDQRT